MTSMFATVLGEDFARLHPQLQRRFSVNVTDGEACIGTGLMEEIWHARWAVPFLALGGSRNVLVPREGRDVPFTIENVPYLDGFGRETVSFVRTFLFPDRVHRFDAQMVLGRDGDRIVDYLGTHQHLASDLHLSVDDQHGLVIRSGVHRFREGPVDVGVPALLGAEATVRESFDERTGRFRIQVQVEHPCLGPVFGYRGSFTATYVEARTADRPGLRPVREEVRA